MQLATALFYGFMLLGLVGFVYAAIARQLIYSLLGALVGLFALSWLLMFSGAETVGVAHLVIYVGGILILFLFGIFLTARKNKTQDIPNEFRAVWTPLLVSVFFFAMMLQAVIEYAPTLESKTAKAMPTDNPKALGIALMSVGSPALELVAVLLLLALLGAGYFLQASQEDA